MATTKLLIVEDEPIIAADLSMQLTNAGMDVLNCIDDGEEVFPWLEKHQPDVIIMDIKLFGDLDGIDVANHVNRSYDIPIIFLTSNTDMATFKRAKLSYPHAFLSKPFRINDVLHAIDLALVQRQSSNDDQLEFMNDRIFIRSKESLEKVLFEDIQFLEADGSYSKIKTQRKDYVISQTLKKTEANIDANFLVRVHRSFVINIKKIDRLVEGYVYIDENKIPVSRSYRDQIHNLLRTI